MKTLNSNFDGGLRFNWDDLRWLSAGIVESIVEILKGLTNDANIHIVTINGITTQVLSYNISNYINLSSGIVAVDGEIMPFDGFILSGFDSAEKFWFVVDVSYDASGVKTDKIYQLEHQCYEFRKLVLKHGADYPAGTVNVDYFPLEHGTVMSGQYLIPTLFSFIKENTKQNISIIGIVYGYIGWDSSSVNFANSGYNSYNITGSVRRQTGGNLNMFTVPKHAVGIIYTTAIRKISATGVYEPICISISDSGVVSAITDVEENDLICFNINYVA